MDNFPVYRQPSNSAMSRFVKIPLYVLGFICLGFLFAYITFSLMSFSRTVDVPGLAGMSLVEAHDALSKKGLNLKIEAEDFDSSVAPGYVIRQDIPAGAKVKENRSIKVIVSRGTKARTVPLLVGESLEKAENILIQRGMRIDMIIRVHSNAFERDRVIAQKPGPDEWAAEKIRLVVSAGTYDTVYYCPEFIGKKPEEAMLIADRLGLKMKIVGSGDIIKSQRPKPGVQIRAGDMITAQTTQE